MIEQQEQVDLEFQRLLTQEIGCGPGYWLCEMARAYPHLSCMGLDQDGRQISSANILAQQLGLTHTTFLARRLDDLYPGI